MASVESGSFIEAFSVAGTIFFGLAILHTFFTKKILDFSHRFPKDSFSASFFHLLGEVEAVFAIWALLFYGYLGAFSGWAAVVNFHENLHLGEPLFVFCVMVLAASRPIMWLASETIMFLSHILSKLLKIPQTTMDVFCVLTLGPLSGSLITEPAAMTVTALLLFRMLPNKSDWFLHFLLGALFVNISIGGAMTPFAAPPLLMVVGTWNWDLNYVFLNFGWRALLTVSVSSLFFVLLGHRHIQKQMQSLKHTIGEKQKMPWAVVLSHYLVMILIIFHVHNPKMLSFLFVIFLALTTLTPAYQDRLRLKESLLVACFLAGIIVFGPFQKWWLQPLLTQLSDVAIFYGATVLTAFTDNAALTYLGAQVPGLSEVAKYKLVAGALTGGGLTLIANAPNAAGFGILQPKLSLGFHAGKLFVAALGPTLIAIFFFQLLHLLGM